MLYLLDANVLIDADRDYYPLNRVPEFWAWIVDRATKDQTKIPLEMCEEVLKGKIPKGKDDLPNWLKANRDVMQLSENADARIVTRVTESGYASNLTDQEVERIGLDPFLIAYALVDPTQRIVVTTETSRPSRKRANRHIPDVCKDLGVLCRTSYEFFRELDFRTDWHR